MIVPNRKKERKNLEVKEIKRNKLKGKSFSKDECRILRELWILKTTVPNKKVIGLKKEKERKNFEMKEIERKNKVIGIKKKWKERKKSKERNRKKEIERKILVTHEEY